MYLLETNACIRLLNGSSAPLVRRFKRTAPQDVRLSSVVKSELLFGARRSTRVADNMRLLTDFFAPFVSLPFDDSCALHAGQIRAELARAGAPIGPNDLLIAATALAHGLILVSNDTAELSRVVGLRLEDWEEA